MARGLFITGTGTDVGKTYVAALIARDLVEAGARVGVYKPVASGCQRSGDELVSDDARVLWNAAGRPQSLAEVCPQRFAAPLAPNLAARQAGQTVDSELLVSGLRPWLAACDVVIVEGAGGLLSPLTDDWLCANLAQILGLPLVVVAANRLGMINDTLQTVVAASVCGDGLPLAGVVVTDTTSTPDSSYASNVDELARWCVPPILARVPWQGGFDRPVVWARLAGEFAVDSL